MQTIFPTDEFLGSLIVQVWSDYAGNAIETRMTHELHALNIFHELRCFCLGRSFDLSAIIWYLSGKIPKKIPQTWSNLIDKVQALVQVIDFVQ